MLIEARRAWGGDVLAVAHLPARRVVRLADFGLPGTEGDLTIVFEHGRLRCDAVDLGGGAVFLELVEEAPRLIAGELGEFRTTKGVVLAAALHATLLAMAFIGRAAPHEEDASQLETLKALSAALDARDERPAPELSNDEPGPAKAGEPGTAGSPMAAPKAKLAMRSKGAENPDVKRQQELHEAREFGMIGLLTSPETARSGGDNPFSSYEGPSAVGNIFGTQIGDAFGMGGASLSSTGLGGGGKGGGITIDGAGGQGFGSCHCGLGTIGHVARAPSVSEGSMHANGRLPPEIVQRIVRQNFGRMRGCYETALVRNPGLEGRIAVKFVIDRSGAVAMVNATESSLADSSITSCVERAFQSMSFPPPEGGIVTVVYPLVMST